MSLRKAKTLFCIATIAIAVLLYAAGGAVYLMASIVVLGGALPSWELITKVVGDKATDDALTAFEYRVRDRLIKRREE